MQRGEIEGRGPSQPLSSLVLAAVRPKPKKRERRGRLCRPKPPPQGDVASALISFDSARAVRDNMATMTNDINAQIDALEQQLAKLKAQQTGASLGSHNDQRGAQISFSGDIAG